MTPYDIVTIDGDGIGPEVCQSAVTVLRQACGSRLRFTPSDGGAAHAVAPQRPVSNGRRRGHLRVLPDPQ